MISRISRNAVKEGFDTLPAAICYFDRNGLLRLINHRMQEIAAVLCGCDLQTLTDLEQALHSPGGGVQLRDEAARIYAFPDGTVYHFAVRPVQDKYGIPYTEVMATDVTQLAALHAALQQENERLADANRRAKRLYDNMPDIVREEEILKMKMRVHDDIGHTLLAARRALRHEHDLTRIKSEAAEWESSISLLCRARQEDAAEDPLTCMQRRAAVLGAAVQLRGAYPAARATRELYALILRECTSNAVRHAGATELYADSEHRPHPSPCPARQEDAGPAEAKAGGCSGRSRTADPAARATRELHLPAMPRPAGECCRGPAELYAKAGGCSGCSRTAARCVPCGTRHPRALRTDPAGVYLQRCAACGRHGIVRRFRASATGMAPLHHEQRRTA